MDFQAGYVLRVARPAAQAGLEGAVEAAPELPARPRRAALRLGRGRRDAVLEPRPAPRRASPSRPSPVRRSRARRAGGRSRRRRPRRCPGRRSAGRCRPGPSPARRPSGRCSASCPRPARRRQPQTRGAQRLVALRREVGAAQDPLDVEARARGGGGRRLERLHARRAVVLAPAQEEEGGADRLDPLLAVPVEPRVDPRRLGPRLRVLPRGASTRGGRRARRSRAGSSRAAARPSRSADGASSRGTARGRRGRGDRPRRAHDARRRVGAVAEDQPRLRRDDVGRVAGDQVEALAAHRRVPVALAPLDVARSRSAAPSGARARARAG